MEIKKELVFIGCSRYDFKDDSTGRSIKGSKVFAVDFTKKNDSHDRHGFVVSDFKADYDLFPVLEKLTPLKPYAFHLNIFIDGKKTSVEVFNVDYK